MGFRLADEVRSIQRRAANHDGRIITIGQLALFSTDTGDAWLLDRSDQLAAPLARNGDLETVHIEETDTAFSIGWKGSYRLDGPAFVYSDRETGRVLMPPLISLKRCIEKKNKESGSGFLKKLEIASVAFE